MKRRVCGLTTIDNPYNPITEFRKWYNFDRLNGYNTANYLARISYANSELFPKDYDEEIERAIDEIIEYNPLKIYKKVVCEIDEGEGNQDYTGEGLENDTPD